MLELLHGMPCEKNLKVENLANKININEFFLLVSGVTMIFLQCGTKALAINFSLYCIA
jgi:hypothetical protein